MGNTKKVRRVNPLAARRERINEVNEYFSELKSLFNEMPSMMAVLDRIRRKCGTGVMNWRLDVELLLAAQRANTTRYENADNKDSMLTQIESLSDRLKKLPEASVSGLRELAVLVVCLFSSGVLAYGAISPERVSVFACVVFSLCMGGLIPFFWSRYVVTQVDGMSLLMQMLTGSFILGLIGYLLILLAQTMIFSYTLSGAKADSELNQSSDGYVAFAKRFMKDNYGLPLEVASTQGLWVSTYIRLEGVTGSPASMLPEPGLCKLVYSEQNVDDWLGIKSPVLNDAIKRLVIIHELAHCLGIKPDFMGINRDGRLAAPIRSMSPSDRDGIDTLEKLSIAEKKPSVSLYREALADVFALGYAKLNMSDQLPQILHFWLEKRARKSDITHHTNCWLIHANSAPAPAANAELREWAFKQVETANCSLEAELKK